MSHRTTDYLCQLASESWEARRLLLVAAQAADRLLLDEALSLTGDQRYELVRVANDLRLAASTIPAVPAWLGELTVSSIMLDFRPETR